MVPFLDNEHSGHWRFRLADRITVAIESDRAAKDKMYRAFYGLMRQPDAEHTEPADITCRLTDARLPMAEHTIEQRYKGGSWRIEMDRLEMPAVVHIHSDWVGGMMSAQAGLGGLLRYFLGQAGFAWLHAATLTRGGEALVLAGPSGIGKSQLVLRAIRDGWRYITDDHTLVSKKGLSGLTTPVLVRGYGGWPVGIEQPASLSRRRCLANIVRRMSCGRINLMCPFTPKADQTCVSPAARPYRTRVCFLRRVGCKDESADHKACEVLSKQARDAAWFMDDWLCDLPGTACEDFWAAQDSLIASWLSTCQTIHAEVPARLTAQSYAELAPVLGLEVNRDG